MTHIHTTKNLSIEIDSSVISNIKKIALQHFPNEFGGFLIGRYSSDFKSAIIEGFIQPVKYEGTSTYFQRSTDGIEDILKKEFEINRRFYIGEWHSHPNCSVMCSNADINAMKEIANCSSVRIMNPILLIVSIDKNRMTDYAFYHYSNNNLYKYE